MKSDIKERWIEALLSGRYRQGRGKMRDKDDRYCCLGVLCDITNPAGWLNLENGSCYGNRYKNDGANAYVPHSLAEECGLGDDVQKELAIMNDEGETFAEIAAHIREHVT